MSDELMKSTEYLDEIPEVTEVEEWERNNRVLERITALENGSRLVGTGNLIAEIMDRLKRLEGQTQFETSEDDARIRDINRRLDALEGHPRRMDRLQPISADKIRRAEQEFSTGTRGPDILSMTNTQVGAFASEYNRGYIAGQNSMVEEKNAFEGRILGDAESRVRQHMRGGSFPETTIAGVVQALRGDENYRGRFEDSEPWYSKPAEDMTLQDYSDGVYSKKDPTA